MVPSARSMATCFMTNLAKPAVSILPRALEIAAITRCAISRIPNRVAAISPTCTAGAVGGNSHAAASSIASRPSELAIIHLAYSISSPTCSAESPIPSKNSAIFLRFWFSCSLVAPVPFHSLSNTPAISSRATPAGYAARAAFLAAVISASIPRIASAAACQSPPRARIPLSEPSGQSLPATQPSTSTTPSQKSAISGHQPITNRNR
ncbi:hypothetical protein NONI108955_40860 [Nocardia ninae]